MEYRNRRHAHIRRSSYWFSPFLFVKLPAIKTCPFNRRDFKISHSTFFFLRAGYCTTCEWNKSQEDAERETTVALRAHSLPIEHKSTEKNYPTKRRIRSCSFISEFNLSSGSLSGTCIKTLTFPTWLLIMLSMYQL